VTPPTLESYRRDDPVGAVAYLYGTDDTRPLLFHDSANAAFYITLDALNRFQEHDTIGGNEYVIPAIGLWFLATESFVSTVYKVAGEDYTLAQQGVSPSTGSQPKSTIKLLEKFRAIEDYFAAPKPRPKSPAVTLGEFATLRNTLFHDLTGVKQPTFSYTMFSTLAEHVNEVDLMQGMITSVDVFEYFRYLFPETDLMPSIHLGSSFEKLDTLAVEVLCPTFADIVTGKGLSTALTCAFTSTHIAASAPLPLRVVIKYEGPLAPRSTIGTDRISTQYMDGASRSRPVPKDQFGLPNYSR
jgi:hypothetical protein